MSVEYAEILQYKIGKTEFSTRIITIIIITMVNVYIVLICQALFPVPFLISFHSVLATTII